MTFANPLALLWGLLAVPIVVLYLRSARLRRQPVATDVIWQQVFADEAARSAWSRWRYPVSLAVQLTILIFVVVALADPQIPGPRRLVLIIDNSGSMNATDVKPTRLAAARQAARAIIGGLREGDSAAVLSAGDAVGVRCGLTNDVAVLGEALDALPITTGATRVEAAVALAGRMLGGASAGPVVLITDGGFRGARELAAADDVEIIRVGGDGDNVAITRLRVRRRLADPAQCEGLVAVENFSGKAVACDLELALEGKPLQTLPINLPGNGRVQKIFAIATANAGRLTARLNRPDDYAEDNTAAAGVPAAGQQGSDSTTELRRLAGYAQRRRESDLRVPVDLGRAASATVARPWLTNVAAPSPWIFLAVAAGLLLVLEWCFYQRRWLC